MSSTPGPETATPVPSPSLTFAQGRVVGSLIEKQLTTPNQYPLSLNALALACNQSSNRTPVVELTESEIADVVAELKEARLVRFVLPSHGRSVVRYRHVLDEAWGLDPAQLALLATLLLRGPQTAAELRTRSERAVHFEHLAEVEHTLGLLAERDGALVVRLPRRPGQKEERWAQLLAPDDVGPAEPWSSDRPQPGPAASDRGPSDPAPLPSLRSELDELRGTVAEVATEVAALRSMLEELQRSLGG